MKVKKGLRGPILFVDNNEDVRESMMAYLEMKNYFLVEYGTGLEAIGAIKNDLKYKVAIIDLSLPDVGGDEVIKVSKEVNPDAHVISLSGWALGEYRPKFQSDEHVKKGLHAVTNLKRALDKYFERINNK